MFVVRGLGWAWLPHGMWSVPGSGIELMSFALAGEFLSTGTLGKFLFSCKMQSGRKDMISRWINKQCKLSDRNEEFATS